MRRHRFCFAVVSIGLAMAISAQASPPKRRTVGAICIHRESVFPSQDGQPPPPMPPRTYFFRIDGGQPIPVRPDAGTLVPGLDRSIDHGVALFRGATPIASTRVRLTGPKSLCVGIQEPGAIGVWSWWSPKFCGCAE